jgi:Tol biopolymer transport system component
VSVSRRLTSVTFLCAVGAALVAGCGGDESTPDLAFVSSRDGDYAVFVMAASGSGERRLTDADRELEATDSPFFQVEPAWSGDGSRIAFVSGRSGSADIYVMNADGSGTRRLTATTQNDSHPTWEPAGERLAFARDGEISLVNADGGEPTRISDVLAEESDPSWSPDGAWIAYVRRTPGTAIQNVWVMRPDGSERRPLTRQDGRAFTPAWSPDSRRIAFATNAESDDAYELFTVGLDGTGLRRVAPTAGDNFEPSWSPDGSKIAYQEAGAIFTVELGGGEVEKLTDGTGNDSSPVWNPAPA